MKRCLIIIGNEGTPGNFLPGVKSDVANYLSFFKSDNAGAWEDDEIIAGNYTWSKETLHNILLTRRMDGLDYVLIVFVGHGYAERNGQIYFEVSPNNEISLDDIKSFFPKQKVMLIADSCQSYAEEALRERSLLCEARDAASRREELKKIYNRQIEAVCGNAFTFASAVSPGEGAREDSRGGVYSRSLLEHAKKIANDPAYYRNEVVNINRIHFMAEEDVTRKSGNEQHPYISISCGEVYPPFYVK